MSSNRASERIEAAREAAFEWKDAHPFEAQDQTAVTTAFIAGADWVRAEYAPLVAAARAVAERWDEVLPSIQGAESMAYVHGWRYKGPPDGIKPHFEALRAALEQVEGATNQNRERA